MSDLADGPVRSVALNRQVIDYVRRHIRSGDLRPGVMYSVYRLADELGVSRSPVREALTRLEEAGLIRFAKNRGFEVISIGPADVVEIFGIRIAVEVPAARRAALNPSPSRVDSARRLADDMRAAAGQGDVERFFDIDQEFHDAVLTLGAGRRTREIVENLRLVVRTAGTYTTDEARSLDDITEEHLPILAALEAGDPDAAGRSMRDHLVSTGRLLLDRVATEDPAHAASLWAALLRAHGID